MNEPATDNKVRRRWGCVVVSIIAGALLGGEWLYAGGVAVVDYRWYGGRSGVPTGNGPAIGISLDT